MKQCEFCGSELPSDARFCGICGKSPRDAQQKPREINNYPVFKQNNAAEAGSAGMANDPRRSARGPYQFPAQSSGADPNGPVAGEPPVMYSRQQLRLPAPEQVYPPAAPVTPALPARSRIEPRPIVGSTRASDPDVPGPGLLPQRPRRPRKRRGCLVGCLVVLLLLCVVGSFSIVTLQKVMAFGSAISTQAPLSTQTDWMGTSDRVNLLVMGYGGSGHAGAYLTDSMVVMSLLPQSQHTTLVSVPRDLWVQIPEGSGNYGKINSVYEDASNNNANPVAGGTAAVQKISLVTGMDVKYWLTINFTGFRDFINAIGGIDVYVPDSFNACYPKNDDASVNASWIKVQFNKGMQHMDGERAIEYARAREPLEVCGMGTSENQAELTDFARSARQQIIIKAALSKVKQISTWPSLYKALDVLSHALYTNLSLADLVQFALKMDLTKAHRVGLTNDNVLMDSSSSDGQYILVPRVSWQAVKDYVKQQLYN